jgi:hypothetical protein
VERQRKFRNGGLLSLALSPPEEEREFHIAESRNFVVALLGFCVEGDLPMNRPLTPALSPDGGEGEEQAVHSLNSRQNF